MTEKMDNPTFNLKAVVRETSLKPDTLRAWERRYGLPQPTRSSGRHRLYSQKDIDTLKWLVARREEGLSISRAVALWESYSQEGLDPLSEMPLSASMELSIPHMTGEAIEGLRKAWVDACKAFDERLAEAILVQAFAQFSPEIVVLELLTQGLSEIGENWYRGEMTVQQEHFASAIALRRLEMLISATPAPNRPGKILVACAPEDDHTYSALLISFLLRRNGWDVLYLGANLPAERLDEALRTSKPDLAIFTSQHLQSAANLVRIAEHLHEIDTSLAFGGSVFRRMPTLQDRIPGIYFGDDVAEVLEAVDRLFKQQPQAPRVTQPPPAYDPALKQFLEFKSSIEQKTLQELEGTEIPREYLSLANASLSREIVVSMELGDIGFLGHDIVWVGRMLQNHGLPREYLSEYLNAYNKAMNDVLDQDSEPILEYFSELVEQVGTGEGDILTS